VAPSRQAQDIVIEGSAARRHVLRHQPLARRTLTELRTIKQGLDRLRSLERMKDDGTYDQLPKKRCRGSRKSASASRSTSVD